MTRIFLSRFVTPVVLLLAATSCAKETPAPPGQPTLAPGEACDPAVVAAADTPDPEDDKDPQPVCSARPPRLSWGVRIRPAIPLALLMACAANPSDATTGSDSGSSGTETGTPTTGATSFAESTGGQSTGESSTGALEAGLRLHQLQAMGTHNSYHISSGDSVKDLDYTHKPVAEQLDAGVRQFEFDINFKAPVEPYAGDYSRAMAALASGATFISTDYPPPKGEIDYVFEIPGGTPSRCNPRSAAVDCTPAEIESP